jgi:hypothetical protein
MPETDAANGGSRVQGEHEFAVQPLCKSCTKALPGTNSVMLTLVLLPCAKSS